MELAAALWFALSVAVVVGGIAIAWFVEYQLAAMQRRMHAPAPEPVRGLPRAIVYRAPMRELV